MSVLGPLHRQLLRRALDGMADAPEKQVTLAELGELSFPDRLDMRLDREATRRRVRSYRARLRRAQLRVRATISDASCKAGRGLTRMALLRLAVGDWICRGASLIVSGKTGSGKTFLACAPASQSSRQSYAVLNRGTGDLWAETARARNADRLPHLQRMVAQLDLPALEVRGLVRFTVERRSEYLDVVERRERRKSILLASRFPTEPWRAVNGEPTTSDAFVDLPMKLAYCINLRDPPARSAGPAIPRSGRHQRRHMCAARPDPSPLDPASGSRSGDRRSRTADRCTHPSGFGPTKSVPPRGPGTSGADGGPSATYQWRANPQTSGVDAPPEKEAVGPVPCRTATSIDLPVREPHCARRRMP